MQRLARNIGGYKGETIDIAGVLRDIDGLALRTGWAPDPIVVSETLTVPAYHKPSRSGRKHVYISAGIHGDEPATPLAARKLFQEHRWPDHLNLWIIPCLNPLGFTLNCRENEAGIDLNRDYLARKSELTRAHTAWLDERPPFTLGLCLHEDWESAGFYVYELNPDLQPSLADAIIHAVQQVCPIDPASEIEGRQARNGVICANPDLTKRPDWPEAFYLIHHKTRLNYTLEAPSDFLLPTRIHALSAGVRAVLENI
jgi:hypothetical protein